MKNVNIKGLTSLLLAATVFIFVSCKEDDPKPDTEKFHTVTSFTIDKAGKKYLGTDKGLFSLDANGAVIEKVELTSQLASINDLKPNKNANSTDFWIASDNGVLNLTSERFLSSSNSELENNKIAGISIDGSDRVYFAWANGISILDNNQWVQNPGKDNLFQNHAISDLATTTDGYTYVGTNGGGVERFKCDVDGISGATLLDTDWTKLKSNTIITVFSVDTIQAYGTDKGAAIHFSEFTKWDWITYTTKNGLISDTVISIVGDGVQNWWFGTYRGLSHVDGDNWNTYTVANSQIPSDTIRFLETDLDGSIWMATDKGLSHLVNGQWINILK